MHTGQSIRQPHGVTTFGACVVRVDPDYATMNFSVVGLETKASAAVDAARTTASAIHGFLEKSGLDASARRNGPPRLTEAHEMVDGVRKFVGYRATIAFNITIEDLDRAQAIAVGVADGGAKDVEGLSYRTRRLRDARAEARQGAVLAAFKKAELYSEAAGVQLGRVLHIEDVGPDGLDEFAGGTDLSELDEFQTSGAYDPGRIAVHAGVVVSFGIKGAGVTAEVTGQYKTFP